VAQPATGPQHQGAAWGGQVPAAWGRTARPASNVSMAAGVLGLIVLLAFW
jgi:hypothetical protein